MRRTVPSTVPAPTNVPPMKNEEAGMPMSGEGAPIHTQQPNPGYNGQTAPQAGYTGESMQYQGGTSEQQMLQESYSGSQYSQGQTQSHSNQPQYPIQAAYPQGQQVPPQSHPSPQGSYAPQYGGAVPQQVSHLGPRDGGLEIRSPTEEPKTNDPHHF